MQSNTCRQHGFESKWNDTTIDHLIATWNDKSAHQSLNFDLTETSQLFYQIFANYFRASDLTETAREVKEDKIITILNTKYFTSLPTKDKLLTLFGLIPPKAISRELPASSQIEDPSQFLQYQPVPPLHYLIENKADRVLLHILSSDYANVEFEGYVNNEFIKSIPEKSDLNGLVELQTVGNILHEKSVRWPRAIEVKNVPAHQLSRDEAIEESVNKVLANSSTPSSIALELALEHFGDLKISFPQFKVLVEACLQPLPEDPVTSLNIKGKEKLEELDEAEVEAGNADKKAQLYPFFKSVLDRLKTLKNIDDRTFHNPLLLYQALDAQDKRMLLVAQFYDEELKGCMNYMQLSNLELDAIKYPFEIYKLFLNKIATHIDPKECEQLLAKFNSDYLKHLKKSSSLEINGSKDIISEKLTIKFSAGLNALKASEADENKSLTLSDAFIDYWDYNIFLLYCLNHPSGGIDLNTSQILNGVPAFHWALLVGDVYSAKCFLALGANAHQPDAFGITPLERVQRMMLPSDNTEYNEILELIHSTPISDKVIKVIPANTSEAKAQMKALFSDYVNDHQIMTNGNIFQRSQVYLTSYLHILNHRIITNDYLTTGSTAMQEVADLTCQFGFDTAQQIHQLLFRNLPENRGDHSRE